MNHPYWMRAAVIAATLGAGSVFAETPPVMTDAAPLPAEDRDSNGAIVLQNSMVRAQRDNAFHNSSSQTGVGSVGRGVLRATMKAKAQADLARAREAEAAELYKRGAGSLTDD